MDKPIANVIQPSVFELISCDGLKTGLREALRYLIETLYPNNCNYVTTTKTTKKSFLPRNDEILLIIDLIIEYNYLKSYKACYAEKIFNLVRSPRASNGLAEIDHTIPSLIGSVFVPYINHKLTRYVDQLDNRDIRTANDLDTIHLLRLIKRCTSLINLVCFIRYATGRSKYHDIIHGLSNLYLISNSNFPHEEGEDGGDSNSTVSWSDVVSKTIADSLGRGLTLGSFVIQFLDYWNTRTNSAPLFRTSVHIPDPPKLQQYNFSDEKSSKLCLICDHVRENECVLSNTGYVFCYSCLKRYVTINGKCPVTGNPASVDNIVNIFVSS